MKFDNLDNENYIYSHGSKELINILYNFPNQFEKAEKIIQSYDLKFKKSYANILILGVGNPANTAFRLIKAVSANNIKVPISISPSTKIPSWVSKDTLIIAISHSGKTKEIIEAIEEVLKRGMEVFVVTTGGKIKEKFQDNKKVQIIEYYEDLLPRMAFGYAYVLLTGILSRANLIEISGFKKDSTPSLKWKDIENELLRFTKELLPEIKINDNLAKKLAINLYNNIPVVYGYNKITEVISYRFKVELCTASKIFAHFNTIPEIDHDEIEGWEMSKDFSRNFIVLFIKDNNIDNETRKRIEILKGIFLEKNIKYEEIDIDGENELVIAFKGMFLAIWTSLYLALLYNVDPVVIKLVDNIKKRLG